MKRDAKKYIFAPLLDDWIEHAKNLPSVTDEKTKRLLLELFHKLQEIETCGDDERRELWLSIERGSINEFGNYEDYLEMGDVSDRKEFEELWLCYYPEPQKWYKLITTVWKDIYSVSIDGKLVLQITPETPNEYPFEKSELAKWLLLTVDKTIQSVKSSSYNEFVRQNLPYKKRIGKILREDYWRIFPEEKEMYLENITIAEISLFTKTIDEQQDNTLNSLLPDMTAGKFFDYCRLGYEVNNYQGIDKLSPKELYRTHADGRDDGLLSLTEDSADEFCSWFHDRTRRGGHPWEVCRGGNSTHISLYAQCNESGWWLSLAGSSYNRSIETIKFYLALKKEGLPVFLHKGRELAAMVTGQDFIGIVPADVLPHYCSAMFPDEPIIDYMNLPFEEIEAIIDATIWYSIKDVCLKTT